MFFGFAREIVGVQPTKKNSARRCASRTALPLHRGAECYAQTRRAGARSRHIFKITTLFRRGDLWSPAKRSHRLLAIARIHLPCRAKEAFLRSRKSVINLKPRPPGEVAAPADGEGLSVGTDVPGCPNKTAAGASPRPTKEVENIIQNGIILFKLYRLLFQKP